MWSTKVHLEGCYSFLISDVLQVYYFEYDLLVQHAHGEVYKHCIWDTYFVQFYVHLNIIVLWMYLCVFVSMPSYCYTTLSELEHIPPIFIKCFSYMNYMKDIPKIWINNNTRFLLTGIKCRTILSHMLWCSWKFVWILFLFKLCWKDL